MSLKHILKTSLEDVYEDLKTLTDLSFRRRIFKALKTSFLDVLKLKLDALFKTLKLCLQHVFIAVSKTSFEDWCSRCVWSPKNVNQPLVLKKYFQSPQDQFSGKQCIPMYLRANLCAHIQVTKLWLTTWFL